MSFFRKLFNRGAGQKDEAAPPLEEQIEALPESNPLDNDSVAAEPRSTASLFEERSAADSQGPQQRGWFNRLRHGLAKSSRPRSKSWKMS
jgi:hypothetical protein